jgi:hypothetical protein
MVVLIWNVSNNLDVACSRSWMNSKTPQSVVDILWNFSFNIISSKVGFLKFGTCIAKIHQERECKGLMSTWQLSLMPGDPASYPVIVPHKVKLYC